MHTSQEEAEEEEEADSTLSRDPDVGLAPRTMTQAKSTHLTDLAT